MTWRVHLFACTFEKLNDMFHQSTIISYGYVYMITKPLRLNKNMCVPRHIQMQLDPLFITYHVWWPSSNSYHRDSAHAYLYVSTVLHSTHILYAIVVLKIVCIVQQCRRPPKSEFILPFHETSSLRCILYSPSSLQTSYSSNNTSPYVQSSLQQNREIDIIST